MVIVGPETGIGRRPPSVLPRSLPLSLHLVTCAVSQEGQEERGPGHGGDHP